MVTFNVKTIKSDRIENKILKWEMVPSFHKKSWCGGTEVHSNPTD